MLNANGLQISSKNIIERKQWGFEVGCKPLKMVVVTTNKWLKKTTLTRFFLS
jgi:hypothetical protein